MRSLALTIACMWALTSGCGDAGPAADTGSAGDALNVVTLGLHDGAINFCDNFEKWGATSPPNYAATAADMGDAGWWTPLHVGTVRVSVPWDIAVAWNYAPGDLLSQDPSGAVGGGKWGNNHVAALKTEQTCFDYWLAAAMNAGEVVNVAFKPDYDYRAPDTNHILVPDIDTYRTAIQTFVDEYVKCSGGVVGGNCVPKSHLNGGPGPAAVARVHIITPWGEPDYGNPHYPLDSKDRSADCSDGCMGNSLPSANVTAAKEVFFLPSGSSPMDPHRARFDDPACKRFTDDACGPVLAAQMWMAIAEACPECVLDGGKPMSGVVAGDFSGGGGLNSNGAAKSYVATYAAHLNHCDGCAGTRPPTWAMHPYPDASNEEWCLQRTGHDYDPAANHGAYSTTERFLNALDEAGYHENTSVWLDEVSVFGNDDFPHHSIGPRATNGASCGSNKWKNKPSYKPEIEAKAFGWLFHTLPNIRGTKHPGHEPKIDRIYYFRSFAGNDPNGDNISPVNPTLNAAALYAAIVNR